MGLVASKILGPRYRVVAQSEALLSCYKTYKVEASTKLGFVANAMADGLRRRVASFAPASIFSISAMELGHDGRRSRIGSIHA